MAKELFFTEKFFKDLNEHPEMVLSSKNKVIIRGTTTITLIPSILLKSENRSFSITEDEAVKNGIDINMAEVEIKNTKYSIIKGFLGKKDLSLIELLIEEHKVLLSTVGKIQKELNNDNCNCENLNMLLNLLFEQLLEHLKKEDTYLYKNYLKKESVVEIINLYKDSMKLISKTAMNYYNKWKDSITQNNIASFRAETAGIIDVLGKRITNEEEIFFPELLK
jgi:hypothetical protein